MRYLMILAMFMLTGCDLISTNSEPKSAKPVYATCKMSNFKSFPRSVTGQIVFNTQTTVTVAIMNRNNSERVDITFMKNKCRW